MSKEKQFTSHDMARNLQLAAEWILARPEFEVGSEAYAESYNYAFFTEKPQFLAAIKAIGAGRKEWGDTTITFVADIPGGRISISAPRTLACRVVRQAETEEVVQTVTRIVRPAEYDCDPFLTPAEEAVL